MISISLRAHVRETLDGMVLISLLSQGHNNIYIMQSQKSSAKCL